MRNGERREKSRRKGENGRERRRWEWRERKREKEGRRRGITTGRTIHVQWKLPTMDTLGPKQLF